MKLNNDCHVKTDGKKYKLRLRKNIDYYRELSIKFIKHLKMLIDPKVKEPVLLPAPCTY